MIFAKDLILKGVAGLAVVGSAGAGVWWYTTQKPENNTSNETNELETLASNVGLECTGTPTATTAGNCTKKTGSENIKVKKEENITFELSSIPNGGGKIKVYKAENTDQYNKSFKFVIEDNDISESNNKLEQFETYEIKQEGGEWKLIRKTKSKGSIERALGLPSDCNLPESSNSNPPNNSTSCNDLDEAKIKKINFEGKKEGGATISGGGKVNLTIKKITSSDGHFPFGYIFSFNPTQPLSISSTPDISIEANKAVEFKIKRKDNNSISLEKAWDLNSLAEKAGLKECNEANGKTTCNIDDTKLNIKHDENTKEEGKSKSTTTPEGKIRVHEGNAGHKEGFKFTIEDGDIALTGSTSTISKLEEFETYEIEEDGGKYYLSRKTKALKEIAKLLGTPDTCNQLGETDQTASCTNLTKDTLKNIKFEGKGDSEVTISEEQSGSSSNISLKISRASSTTDFPLGYKFTISSDKEITIPQSGTSITIKKKSDADFKIKKTNSNTLTLEKAWDINKLAGKISLTGCNSSDSGNKCNFGEKINVYESDSQNATELVVKDHSGKKITYEVDQEGYNQGFKFKVEEDITLENGTTTMSGTPPEKITRDENNSNTYEIKEMTLGSGTNWYLAKKAN